MIITEQVLKKYLSIAHMIRLNTAKNFLVWNKVLKIISYGKMPLIIINTVIPPYLWEITFQDPQWMPETEDTIELSIYYAFPIHIHL